MFVGMAVVLLQQVPAKVAVKIPPDGVDVVGVVLCVVVFDEETFTMNAVVMTRARLQAACPRKVHIFKAFPLNAQPFFVHNFRFHSGQIHFHEPVE